jgi:hypothetical protein
VILAIDPGPKQSAFVVWDGESVICSAWLPNDELREGLNELVERGVARAAIEMIACYGMAVGAETFNTCVEIGRLVERLHSLGITTDLIPRMEVKVHLCHSAKAKDPNVRQALIDRLGVVGTKKNPGPLFGVKSHIWAALAVAVYAWDSWEAGDFDPVRDGWVGKDGRP